MELVITSLGILVALIVTAAVMDLRARRNRRAITVDSGAILDARRRHDSRGNMYDHGGGGGG